MSMKVSIEYRVKPVTRYIVTRFEQCEEAKTASMCGRGEFDNADTAYAVGYALCKADHDRLGYEVGSELIKYPKHPNQINIGENQEESKEMWNTSISEVPQDILKKAKSVSREMNVTSMDGSLKPEHYIALALWNERLARIKDYGVAQ